MTILQALRGMLFVMKNVFLTASLLILSACGNSAAVSVDSNPSAADEGTGVMENLNKGGVIYTEYSDRLVGHGKSSVLFFFKASDPFSVRNDAIIKNVYATGAAVVTTYRVDFPTATGARLKYGVLVEDTLVLLDAAGEPVASFIHPSRDEIHIILRGNIPVTEKP